MKRFGVVRGRELSISDGLSSLRQFKAGSSSLVCRYSNRRAAIGQYQIHVDVEHPWGPGLGSATEELN